MVSNGADQILGQVAAQAQYETLREVANQLSGVLYARERSTPAHEQARWREEDRAIRARVRDIEPGTPDVEHALGELSVRLRELRGERDR